MARGVGEERRERVVKAISCAIGDVSTILNLFMGQPGYY